MKEEAIIKCKFGDELGILTADNGIFVTMFWMSGGVKCQRIVLVESEAAQQLLNALQEHINHMTS